MQSRHCTTASWISSTTSERSLDEATDVLETAARGDLQVTSLAEESRPPAASGERH